MFLVLCIYNEVTIHLRMCTQGFAALVSEDMKMGSCKMFWLVVNCECFGLSFKNSGACTVFARFTTFFMRKC